MGVPLRLRQLLSSWRGAGRLQGAPSMKVCSASNQLVLLVVRLLMLLLLLLLLVLLLSLPLLVVRLGRFLGQQGPLLLLLLILLLLRRWRLQQRCLWLRCWFPLCDTGQPRQVALLSGSGSPACMRRGWGLQP